MENGQLNNITEHV